MESPVEPSAPICSPAVDVLPDLHRDRGHVAVVGEVAVAVVDQHGVAVAARPRRPGRRCRRRPPGSGCRGGGQVDAGVQPVPSAGRSRRSPGPRHRVDPVPGRGFGAGRLRDRASCGRAATPAGAAARSAAAWRARRRSAAGAVGGGAGRWPRSAACSAQPRSRGRRRSLRRSRPAGAGSARAAVAARLAGLVRVGGDRAALPATPTPADQGGAEGGGQRDGPPRVCGREAGVVCGGVGAGGGAAARRAARWRDAAMSAMGSGSGTVRRCGGDPQADETDPTSAVGAVERRLSRDSGRSPELQTRAVGQEAAAAMLAYTDSTWSLMSTPRSRRNGIGSRAGR